MFRRLGGARGRQRQALILTSFWASESTHSTINSTSKTLIPPETFEGWLNNIAPHPLSGCLDCYSANPDTKKRFLKKF